MKTRVLPVPVRMPPLGLFVLASRHAAGFAMPWTAHGYAKIACAVDGAGALEVDGAAAAPFAAGDAVLVPARTRHRFVDDPRRPLALLVLCLDEDVLARGPAADAWRATVAALGPARPRPLGAWRRTQVERRLRLMLAEQGDTRAGRAAALWGDCLGLCAELQRATPAPRAPRHDDAFAAALARLEERFREPVRIAELAALAGRSYRGFTHRFAAAHGCGPVEHAARLRVAHARRLLAAGTPVIDAALSAGYRDLSHFYRQFRRLVGMPPARWARGERRG